MTLPLFKALHGDDSECEPPELAVQGDIFDNTKPVVQRHFQHPRIVLRKKKDSVTGGVAAFRILRDCRLHLNAKTHQHKGAVRAPFRSQIQHISG